jgi:hypothetical protein
MFTWINCNLLGRHHEIVTSDRSTIHLRCVRCGHRSAGWQLANRSPAFQAARLWQQPVVQMAPRHPS